MPRHDTLHTLLARTQSHDQIMQESLVIVGLGLLERSLEAGHVKSLGAVMLLPMGFRLIHCDSYYHSGKLNMDFNFNE